MSADEPVPATLEERVEFLGLEVADLRAEVAGFLATLSRIRSELAAALEDSAG